MSGSVSFGLWLLAVFRSSVGAFGWRVETGASRGPNFRMGVQDFAFGGAPDRGPNDFRRKSAQNVPASNQPMKIGTRVTG